MNDLGWSQHFDLISRHILTAAHCFCRNGDKSGVAQPPRLRLQRDHLVCHQAGLGGGIIEELEQNRKVVSHQSSANGQRISDAKVQKILPFEIQI